MTWHSLPLFVRLQGRPVILLGDGEAADAKRRLLERAGALVTTDHPDARLAIVALEDEAEAVAAVARLRARGLLVNAVDRPALCDFTLPAIVDRAPVLVAIGTGGASAGLAAALRQRLEGLLPAGLGRLAEFLQDWKPELKAAFPDPAVRRRAISHALAPAGVLDLMNFDLEGTPFWIKNVQRREVDWTIEYIRPRYMDPDELTLREARALSQADRVFHTAAVPSSILDRARADAPRTLSATPPTPGLPGLTVFLKMAREE